MQAIAARLLVLARIAAPTVAIVLAIGCDLVENVVSVTGGYSIARRSEGTVTFLLVRGSEGETEQGGGVLNGRVERIGWSAEVIVAWRRGVRGGDGWMVVDVETGKVSGPFSDTEFAEVQGQDPRLKAVKVEGVVEVWQRLH